MQEAFEKWYSLAFSYGSLEKSEEGSYINPYTRVAYSAFLVGWKRGQEVAE